MARCQLKVYYGPESKQTPRSRQKSEPEGVRLPLGEVLPLLTEAVRNHRTWLHDFEDDEVTISMDLYEVLLAYQFCRRPSA